MKPKRSRQDPIEREIELALTPGMFIYDRACFSFVSELGEVAAKIADLVKSDPARAVGLYETFIAACGVKVEELDDSSGSFGQFVHDLICGWITARRTSGADPDQTAATLLSWMDDDPYAFCYQIEQDAAKSFGKAGLAAFERQVRTRFEAAAVAKPAAGKPLHEIEYLRRRWGDVLRAIYLAQRNITAYVALTGETRLTARDCHALATMHVTRRKPDEALAWVGRGLEVCRENARESTASYDLTKLQRELLLKLGRGNEALDLAWAEFREHPGNYTYDDLMEFVPKAERAAWHVKALDAAIGGDLHSVIELLVELKETGRLADLIRGATDRDLEQVSHYATEPAAKRLEKSNPELAARLWRALGIRIVDAGKSKYYDAALSNFARAKRCYERAGLAAEWEAIVREVRSSHHRKTGFMPGFEALAAGARPDNQPSFLERAKTRWDVGLTITKTSRQRGHKSRNAVQKSRSQDLNSVRGRLRLRTATCCVAATAQEDGHGGQE